MAISFVAEVSGGGNVDNVNLPTVLTNDFAIIDIVIYDNAASAISSVPSGWSYRNDHVQPGSAGIGVTRVYRYYKPLTAAESGTNIAWPNTTGNYKDIILSVFRGVDTSSPFDTASAEAIGNSSVPSIVTGLTTATAGAEVFLMFSGYSNDAGAVAGYTRRSIAQDTVNSSYSANIAAAGAVGTPAGTNSSDWWVALVDVLKPASSFNPTQTVPDTAAGADAVSGQYNATVAQTATGSDSVAAQFRSTVADVSTGTDAVAGQFNATIAQTAAGADAVSGAFTTVTGDTATGTDAVTGQFGTIIADTAAAADAIAAQFRATVADAATAVDAVTAQIGSTIDDNAAGTDSIAAQFHVTIAETATAVDAVFAPGQVGDNASGTDTASGQFNTGVSDVGSGNDAVNAQFGTNVSEQATALDLYQGAFNTSVNDVTLGSDVIAAMYRAVVAEVVSAIDAVSAVFIPVVVSGIPRMATVSIERKYAEVSVAITAQASVTYADLPIGTVNVQSPSATASMHSIPTATVEVRE